MKKLLLIGAILALGATSFAGVKNTTEAGISKSNGFEIGIEHRFDLTKNIQTIEGVSYEKHSKYDSIPLYVGLELKGNTKVNPFASLKGGFALNRNTSDIRLQNGLFLKGNVGVEYKNFDVSAFYKTTTAEFKFQHKNTYTSFGLELGYTFKSGKNGVRIFVANDLHAKNRYDRDVQEVTPDVVSSPVLSNTPVNQPVTPDKPFTPTANDATNVTVVAQPVVAPTPIDQLTPTPVGQDVPQQVLPDQKVPLQVAPDTYAVPQPQAIPKMGETPYVQPKLVVAPPQPPVQLTPTLNPEAGRPAYVAPQIPWNYEDGPVKIIQYMQIRGRA